MKLIMENWKKFIAEYGRRPGIPDDPLRPAPIPDDAPPKCGPGTTFHYVVYNCIGAPRYLDGKPYAAPADPAKWECTACDDIHPGRSHEDWAAWANEQGC